MNKKNSVSSLEVGYYNNKINTNIRFTKFKPPILYMIEFTPFGKHAHVLASVFIEMFNRFCTCFIEVSYFTLECCGHQKMSIYQ